MSNFNIAYEIVKKNEGNKITNDENDKGGETNAGITYPFYAIRAKRLFGVSPSLVHFRNLSEDSKRKIYQDFWRELNIEKINSDVIASFIFDFAVNSGQAVRIIQKTIQQNAVSDIKPDNIIGQVTIASINAATEQLGEHYFLCLLKLDRLAYLHKIGMEDKSQRKFWAGWFRRVLEF